MSWQLIETAPKDGTEILAWREDCGVLLIRWDCADSFLTEEAREDLDDGALFGCDWFCAGFMVGERLEGDEVPTHWMPIPKPPG